MPVLSPAPLRPGDTIAVTAPSAPVPPELRARLDVTLAEVAIDAGQARVMQHLP